MNVLKLSYKYKKYYIMALEKFVHGYHLMYEKEHEDGMFYLNDRLESEYAKVFFVYAKNYRVALFEDQSGRKYSLSYENNLYILNRK
ncbi:MAG: hypothetical protein US63_C0001G0020 [Candidatus Moranbacteria bacterium GW2011_GWC2_37_8]|nr:MAG: hypothetical protein US63_C0001G0020 [Candidatus Moranbacteria bacterium GW2011_GWC2_37_8]KKQ63071.1 MAG: hypothetical protein US82_C0003G0020 [Parcubacteria group bacterium GW2011_GWC1_38_22]KKQ79724.1 MAG: hypothetical protein UT03_C0043G0004 [Candidatus Moranbacteria bacterium GW2011_GWD2_38_7]